MTSATVPIRDKRADDQAWVECLLRERWGGTQVVTRGELLDAAVLPALVAGERQGLLTWRRLDPRGWFKRPRRGASWCTSRRSSRRSSVSGSARSATRTVRRPTLSS